MYLGESLEEKKANYELLSSKSKKWGKVFAGISLVCALFLALIILGLEMPFLLKLLLSLIMIVGMPIGYYFYGQILFYGFIKVKSWFVKNNVDVKEVAGVAGTSILFSYLIGGRKSAKIASISWLIVVGIVISVGIFVGLYEYIKTIREVKKLGIA